MENQIIMKNYTNFINENNHDFKYNIDDKKMEEYILETYYSDLEGQLEDYCFEWKISFNTTTRGEIKEDVFNEVIKSFTKKFDEIAEEYYLGGLELETYCGQSLLDFINDNKEYFDDGVNYSKKYDADDADDEEELREIIEPVKTEFGKYQFKKNYEITEDEFEGFYTSNGNYGGSPTYNYFSEIYSDEDFFEYVFKNVEKYYNVKIDELIDFKKLTKLLAQQISYVDKYSWYVDNICDAETLRKEILDYDPKNAIVLYEECGGCENNFDFQKIMIENLIKAHVDEEMDDFLPEILKDIEDDCGLNKNIYLLYTKYTYLLKSDEYDI